MKTSLLLRMHREVKTLGGGGVLVKVGAQNPQLPPL